MRDIDSIHGRRLELPYPLLRSDCHRSLFDLEDRLLMVATDRVSYCGEPLPETIPLKGRLQTRLARYWFEATRDLIPDPLAMPGAEVLPDGLLPFKEELEGRVTFLKKTIPCAVTCGVRGYLTGSAYLEYEAQGTVCGVQLPPNLKRGARLRRPLFTPCLEDERGRRRPITLSEMTDLVGIKAMQELKARSLALYMRGYHLAWERGIILADARFVFGWLENGMLTLADEALGPGSSRYWSLDQWKPGVEPPRMNERCLLEFLRDRLGWEGTSPVPHLPAPVVEAIRNGYLDLARRFGILP
jgi:phosphoribosylaminoimidazole-succinocarboxamide synthase